MTDFLAKIQLDKKKIIIILVVAAAVAVFDVVVLMNSQLKGVKSVSVKVAKLNKELKDIAKDLVLMRQSQTRPKISLKTKKIISQSDIPYLIQDIYEIANKNRVKIMQLKPDPDRGAREAKTGNFSPAYIQLELTCTYHRLGQFINDLENAGQFIAVAEMRISPDQKDYLQQNTSLLLKTYVKK
jgi:Tfp pilus assembly protein PilO